MPLAVVMLKNNKRYFCVGHIEEKNLTLWSTKLRDAVTFNAADKVERYIRIYLSGRKEVAIEEVE